MSVTIVEADSVADYLFNPGKDIRMNIVKPFICYRSGRWVILRGRWIGYPLDLIPKICVISCNSFEEAVQVVIEEIKTNQEYLERTRANKRQKLERLLGVELHA